MKLFFTKLFFCSYFIFVCFTSIAQTKFYASATPAKAGIDEYITYTLTVDNGTAVEQINHPEFVGFITVSGPNQFSSQTNRNGVVTQSVSLSYILQPKKAGNFQIAASTAIIEGKTYKSNTVSISVSNKKSSNKNPSATNQSPFAAFDLFDEPKPQKKFEDYILRNGETVQENVSRNMQLRLQTDKISCYVGEPILATYKLFTRLQSESNVSKNPSFNGFSVVDMMEPGGQSPYNHESINGRAYNVYVIRKAQLYPLQSGAIELEPATLDNKITFVKNENGNNTMFEENVSLTSKPLTIQVKPLPEAGKPENFTEAVGNFSIEATVEKDHFSTNETGKLLVTISGKGNMQLLTIPEIEWPKNFEVYETKITDNVNNTTIPISGNKTFEIPFTVADTGSHSIPSIKLSFFDPATRSYKMVSTKSILLTISKGTGNTARSIAAPNKKAKPVSLLNKIFASRWLVILLLASIIIVVFIFWLSKEKKKEKQIVLEEIKKEEVKINTPVYLSPNINYLEKTENCLAKDDCVDFYSLLSTELKYFLSKRLSIDKENINSKTLVTIMDNRNIGNTISMQTQQLFEEIEWQLYTPFERSEKLQNMYVRAQTLIQILSKPS
jgi:BatD DUF11 like domain